MFPFPLFYGIIIPVYSCGGFNTPTLASGLLICVRVNTPTLNAGVVNYEGEVIEKV